MNSPPKLLIVLLLTTAVLTTALGCKNTQPPTNTTSNKVLDADTIQPITEETESVPTTSFAPGLSKDAQINTLSADERQQFLKSVKFYESMDMPTRQSVSIVCTTTGILSSTDLNAQSDEQLQQYCIEKRDECIKNYEREFAAKETILPTDTLSETCTATVAEAERCLEASVYKVHAFTEDYPTCKELTRDFLANNDVLEDFSAMKHPPTPCDRVVEKCPELLTLPQPRTQ